MKLTSLLGLTLLVVACDENPSMPPLGSLSVTTASAPSIQQGFTTNDGWNVKYTKFLVNVSAVTVAGSDGVVTASSEEQSFDLVTPEPQVLVSSTNRVARAWQDVSFEVAPAKDTGFSVYVEATMTRGADTKMLKAGFAPDTKYQACTGTLNGVPTPGLVVPKDGADTAAVGFTGDVLFFDNLVTRGHGLRGDPIANADANKDGTIDNAELGAVNLDALRGALVGPGQSLYEATPGVTDLNGFIGEQARSIVATFRDTGTCTPVTATP